MIDFDSVSVPIAAPEIKLESTSSNSLHVSWSPLPNKKSRGVIAGYKIQWKVNNSPSTNVGLVDSNVLDYTITGACWQGGQRDTP